mgnify:CR=1 FL=1|jgi:hypothetical protein
MGNKSGYYKYLRQKKLSDNSQRMFPELYKAKIRRAKIICTIASIIASCALLTLILLIL